MASPAPLLWDRAVPGFTETLAEIVKKHEDMEACLPTPGLAGDRNKLAQLHTKQGLNEEQQKDPCNLIPFAVEEPLKGASNIQSLQEKAGCQEKMNQDQADEAIERITAQGIFNEGLDLNGLHASLVVDQKSAIEDVTQASETLGDIVSLRKGQDELLTAEHGALWVQNAEPEAKRKMYKQLKGKRIAERSEKTIEKAKKMCELAWREHLVNSMSIQEQIAKEKASVHALQQSAEDAKKCEDEVQTILEDIEAKIKRIAEQLDQCKNKKVKLTAEYDKERKAMKALLEQLVIQDEKLSNIHAEHESMRMTVAALEQSKKDVVDAEKAAKDASGPALASCAQWHESAVNLAKSLLCHSEAKSAECRAAMMKPTVTAACNIQLAKKYLDKVASDSEAEMDFLRKEIEGNVATMQRLQEEMDAEEPEQNIDDIESQHAALIDQNKILEDSMEKCRATKQKLQGAVQVYHETWTAVKPFFVGDDVEAAVSKDAEGLANDSYPHYKLFQKGKARGSSTTLLSSVPEGSKAPSAGTLATIDPSLMQYIEKMIDKKAEEKAQQKFDQFRADQFFGGPPSSAAASDPGDFCVVPETGDLNA
jgi:hypothetical protein